MILKLWGGTTKFSLCVIPLQLKKSECVLYENI